MHAWYISYTPPNEKKEAVNMSRLAKFHSAHQKSKKLQRALCGLKKNPLRILLNQCVNMERGGRAHLSSDFSLVSIKYNRTVNGYNYYMFMVFMQGRWEGRASFLSTSHSKHVLVYKSAPVSYYY